MLGVRTRIVWNHAKVAAIVSAMPAAAHQASAEAAAQAAAARVGRGETGALADDVGTPKPMGRYRSMIGSSLPYARIEHFGGTIVARNEDAYGRRLLYIRPGDIVATAPSVFHQGKRYLDVATAVYVQTMPAGLRRFFPR